MGSAKIAAGPVSGRNVRQGFSSFSIWSYLCAFALLGAVLASAPLQGQQAGFTSDKAMFAGGNFWYIQEAFDGLDGIFATRVGFMGGLDPLPSFTSVDRNRTDPDAHIHVIEIRFNAAQITYEQLIYIFLRQIDPTDDGGQLDERGYPYRTGIFYYGEEQRVIAEKALNKLKSSKCFDKEIVTRLEPATNFFPATDLRHLNFHRNYPEQYKQLRYATGRDTFLTQIWGTPEDAKKKLMLPPSCS